MALLPPCGGGAEHHRAWPAVAREHHLAAHDLTWILGHGSLDLADSCHVQAHAAVRAGLGQGRRSNLCSVQGCCLLRSKPSGNTGLIGKGGGGGRGSGYVAVEVDLAADTLLLDERSGDPLGVVRQSGPFECEALCESEQPLVWVEACGVEVRLQAQRVTVPSR